MELSTTAWHAMCAAITAYCAVGVIERLMRIFGRDR